MSSIRSPEQRIEDNRFWNTIDRFVLTIKRNPEIGDKFVEAYRTHLMGPNPQNESDYLHNYKEFWESVYELDPQNFEERVRKYIKEDYELPKYAHEDSLGYITQYLKEQTGHPKIKDLGEDIMGVWWGMGIPTREE